VRVLRKACARKSHLRQSVLARRHAPLRRGSTPARSSATIFLPAARPQTISAANAIRENLMSGNQQRGAGNIKAIFATAILVVIGFTLFQAAPAYMDNYWVQDAMVSEARTAAVSHKNEDDVRETIWKVVKGRNIKATPPIRREDIRVEYTGRAVNISLRYSIAVDLYFYKFSLKFTPNAGDRPIV
jgi:hypothetical protein